MFDKLFLGLAMMTSSVFYGANLAPEGECKGCEAGYTISGFSGAYGGTFQAFVDADQDGECALDADGACKQSEDCNVQVRWTYTPAYPYRGGHSMCWENPAPPSTKCFPPTFSPHVATEVGATVIEFDCGLSAWDTVWIKDWTTNEVTSVGQIFVFCENCHIEDAEQDGE